MKYFLIILTAFLINCGEKHISFKSLKRSGYKEAKCKDIESFDSGEESLIELNKVLKDRESFVLARCFNEKNCVLSLVINKNRLTCQRYIVEKGLEDKRDYFDNNDFKEFDDHKVLYLVISDKNKEIFIKRAN